MSSSLIKAHLNVIQTLLHTQVKRVCAEEASLPPEVIATIVPAGSVSYRYATPKGLSTKVLMTYDLEMPHGLQPRCSDGEVEEFSFSHLGLWYVLRQGHCIHLSFGGCGCHDRELRSGLREVVYAVLLGKLGEAIGPVNCPVDTAGNLSVQDPVSN